eukprot:5455605-Pleurochrysis_carterae.AAC.1
MSGDGLCAATLDGCADASCRCSAANDASRVETVAGWHTGVLEADSPPTCTQLAPVTKKASVP